MDCASTIILGVFGVFVALVVLYLVVGRPDPEEIEEPMITRRDAVLFILVLLGSILLWRGLWNIFDHHFFPDDVLTSSLLCIGMGIFVLVIAAAFAPGRVISF
ncbi:Hypothetical protein POVN_LOCUS305 [uncultured virus]|nr:Hypothetical protein POVN_LOCUS305 [uncultured virus]